MPPRNVPKPKTKTFAGCWTCRRHKVKCDTRRPRCGRCGETCEGYEVELYWKNGEDERPCTVKRRRVLIYDSRLPEQVDLVDIDRMLIELDNMVVGVGGGEAGIVGVGALSAFAVGKYEPTKNLDFSIVRPGPNGLTVAPRELSLYKDSNIAELMDYYIHVVVDLLQPARHSQNPYRSLYVPRNGGSSRGRDEGRLHRLKAIKSLQLSFANADITSDSHTSISAMLLMEGGMTDFWIHLDGCEKLQPLLRAQGADQLLAICAFMSTLAGSTDPCLPTRPWEWKAERPPGITSALAHYMDLTIRLSQHVRYYHIHGLPLPPVVGASHLHSPRSPNQLVHRQLSYSLLFPKGDSETLPLVRCHILAFHAALVIYLYTVTGWSSDPGSTSIVRHYNSICITTLLSAEALETSYGAQAGWNAMAPIVWPGFVAACEAAPDERPLWRTWWVSVQRYCIGKMWQEVSLVVEELEPRWMEVLRGSGRRVMSGG
ncbi:fungal-specific transcription factor domain-containing protein [Aspergillus fruticulosus]